MGKQPGVNNQSQLGPLLFTFDPTGIKLTSAFSIAHRYSSVLMFDHSSPVGLNCPSTIPSGLPEINLRFRNSFPLLLLDLSPVPTRRVPSLPQSCCDSSLYCSVSPSLRLDPSGPDLVLYSGTGVFFCLFFLISREKQHEI